MSKAQRIVIVIILLIMAAILLYPPLVGEVSQNVHEMQHGFIFSEFPHMKDFNLYFELNFKKLIVELLAIATVGAAVTLIFGLKKN